MGAEYFTGGGPVAHRAGNPLALDQPTSSDLRARGRAGAGSAAATHRAPSRKRGPLGDHRGLTAAGGLILILLLGGAGAVLDALAGHGLWVFFSIAFVAGVLISSARVHLEDLAASIFIVPFAYAIVAAGRSLVDELGSGQGLKIEIATAAGVLVFNAPLLLLAFFSAAVIALFRGRAVTMARRRARARTLRRYGSVPQGGRRR